MGPGGHSEPAFIQVVEFRALQGRDVLLFGVLKFLEKNYSIHSLPVEISLSIGLCDACHVSLEDWVNTTVSLST